MGLPAHVFLPGVAGADVAAKANAAAKAKAVPAALVLHRRRNLSFGSGPVSFLPKH